MKVRNYCEWNDTNNIARKHSYTYLFRDMNPLVLCLLCLILAGQIRAADNQGGSVKPPMTEEPLFIKLCRQKDLDPDTAKILVQMMTSAAPKLIDNPELDVSELLFSTEIAAPKLLAKTSPELLKAIWAQLEKKTWFSLQGEDITNIHAVTCLPHLQTLVINANSVSDISVLSKLKALRVFLCAGNQIKDFKALAACPELEELDLRENPAENLKVLEGLPKLRKLKLSTEQSGAFVGCKILPELVLLDLYGQTVCAPRDLPSCPKLVNLSVDKIDGLDGLERFQRLQSLDLTGAFHELSPLDSCSKITHLKLRTSSPLDLAALPQLPELRSLSITAPEVKHIEALGMVKNLRELNFYGSLTAADKKQVESIQKALKSWDADFLAELEIRKPNSHLVVVSQEEFNHFDSNPFGIKPTDLNEELIRSERSWLEKQIGQNLFKRFKDERDITFPFMGGGTRRSFSLCAYSLKAYRAFPEVVAAVQKELCAAKNDWIIHFSSSLGEGVDAEKVSDDTDDFTVWIYPDKIVTTEEDAELVRKLLKK